MTRFFKDVNILFFLLCNLTGCLLLLGLQFLRYALLPAINPILPQRDQRVEAIRFMLKQGVPMLLVIVIGVSLLFWINKGSIFKDTKRSIPVAAIELAILLLTMLQFSLEYVSKFPN